MGLHWKIWFIWGRFHEKPMYRGGLPEKRRAWTVCRFKRGLGKKEEGVFEGGWCPNAHYKFVFSSPQNNCHVE